MKKSILLLVITILCFSFTDKKRKQNIPAGTVQITETFFADKVEISNFAWQEYEKWTEIKFGKNSKEHLAVLPDTLVWRDSLSYNEPYVQYYYRHVGYRDFPVVGISYEQALAYCKWRTERVKEYYAIRYKKDWNIEYRLPTKEEWEFLSNNMLPSDKKNKKGEYGMNCIRRDDTLSYAGIDVTTPVYSYYPNRFGLYNMFGNVAEMVSEKGIYKGGSWHHEQKYCRAGQNFEYTKPTSWLGFRCVCVVKG